MKQLLLYVVLYALSIVWGAAWLVVFLRYPWLPFALALPGYVLFKRWLSSLS